MAYTTNQLISGAYYAAGVVSREFETVSGSQIGDGLQWLNEIIGDKVVDQGMIPYETTYNFDAVIGQEVYFIPNLIQVDTLVFFLDSVRYAMSYTKRNQFFGSPRVENIKTLPFEWYFERVTGGGNLYLYFLPDRAYPMEVKGTFRLAPMQLGQDLTGDLVTADLGAPTLYGQTTYSLSEGQFVVNNVDLFGTYASIGSLINYINSGVVPSVMASLNVNDFVLSSTTEPPVPIYIRSAGYTPSGTRFIGFVSAATTANLTSTYNNGSGGIGATLTAPAPATLVIDGYTVLLNDRILVKNQTVSAQNGSYILTTLGTGSVPWVLTRTTNYNEEVKIQAGDLFTATSGTTNSDTTFIQQSTVLVVGTTPIFFASFSAITFANFSTIENPNYDVFNALGFDQFYITYLRYALADRICSEYNYVTPANVSRQLMEYEEIIRKKSRIIDLRMMKNSTLQKRGQIGWAWVNLGRGFIAPS